MPKKRFGSLVVDPSQVQAAWVKDLTGFVLLMVGPLIEAEPADVTKLADELTSAAAPTTAKTRPRSAQR